MRSKFDIYCFIEKIKMGNPISVVPCSFEAVQTVEETVCFVLHEQIFSYLATVAITDDRAANLDLCLTLTAFSSEVLLRATRDLRF
jgi:hypothetical protein